MPPKAKKRRRKRTRIAGTERSDGGGDAGTTGGTGATERKIKKTSSKKEVSRIVICDKLAERFSGVLIHVEKIIAGAPFVPIRVWCQPSNEEYLLEKYKYTLRTRTAMFTEIIPVSYLNKWKNPTHRRKDILECAYKEIDDSVKHLILTSDEKWSADEGFLQRFEDSDSSSESTSDSDDSDSGSDDSEGGSVPYLFRFRVIRAFLSHMHNSAGRDGLLGFLEYAVKAGLGKNKHGMAGVYQVGTAPYYKDGFPLDLVDINVNKEGKFKWQSISVRGGSSSQSRSRSKSTGSHRRSSSRLSSVSRSSGSSAGHTQQSKPSYIYSDLVIATIRKRWARFVMLCEVKSGYDVITPRDHVQLLQQMIAACMHQTEVLGLLINARFAKLLWLKHNPDEKTLLCYDIIDSPCFVPDPTVGKSFVSESLKGLLFQLVVALNYCKKNIREVKPLEISS